MSSLTRPIAAGALALTACLAAPSSASGADGRVEVGQAAPDFTLPGLDEEHALSALRGEKNALLVFFRGAW